MRRRRLLLHRARPRQAHLRAFQADAQPRKREGRRDRRRRIRPGTAGRQPGDPGRPLHAAYRLPGAGRQGRCGEAVSSRPISISPPPGMLDTVDDWKTIPGLEVKPPDVCRYFVRVKADVLDRFIAENELQELDRREAEDEFVNQNSFKLNQMYLRRPGRQEGLCPLPRQEHHDPEGGRIRRGDRRLLQDRGPLAPMSGSPTSASRPRGASGIPPAPIPSRASTSPWCTTGISPTTIPSASTCCSGTSGRSFSRTRRSRSSCSTS